ncbi:MAG: hypothetical protein AAFV88_00335 [Planctomycetota bacterium]
MIAASLVCLVLGTCQMIYWRGAIGISVQIAFAVISLIYLVIAYRNAGREPS